MFILREWQKDDFTCSFALQVFIMKQAEPQNPFYHTFWVLPVYSVLGTKKMNWLSRLVGCFP